MKSFIKESVGKNTSPFVPAATLVFMGMQSHGWGIQQNIIFGVDSIFMANRAPAAVLDHLGATETAFSLLRRLFDGVSIKRAEIRQFERHSM